MNAGLDLLKFLAPESVLAETAVVVLILGLFKSLAPKRGLLLVLTLLGGIIAGAILVFHTGDIDLSNGMVVLDPLTRLVKLAILALSLITTIFAAGSNVREHFAEYLGLILFSTIGMMLLAGTEDLLMIFIGLEMTSIPLYILTGYLKRSNASAEAALKYFLVGGVSAAFLLFGLSLIYGVTGSTSLHELARVSSTDMADPLLLAGIVMALVGFGFKVAAVPFHLWAPDVYEGAPTPSAALIASGSKVAGFLILAKFLAFGLTNAGGSAAWSNFLPGWLPVLALIGAASVVIGNLAALSQSNVKRILAYSAIAQSGYMLLGLLATGNNGVSSVVFYVIVYALTTLGAFGVVSLVEQRRGGAQLHHFQGLHKSSPGLALSMGVFMISLAGIPPLAGFFGKFYLFEGALGSVHSRGGSLGLLWVIIVAIAFNAVSLYYYLIVLKHVFVIERGTEPEPHTNCSATSLLVGLLAIAVLAIGIYPNLLLAPIQSAVDTASKIEVHTASNTP